MGNDFGFFQKCGKKLQTVGIWCSGSGVFAQGCMRNKRRFDLMDCQAIFVGAVQQTGGFEVHTISI